jgi:hypothetical protein
MFVTLYHLPFTVSWMYYNRAELLSRRSKEPFDAMLRSTMRIPSRS